MCRAWSWERAGQVQEPERRALCVSPGAAVTKHHTLGGLTQFILSHFCELEMLLSHASSEGSRVEPFLASPSVWKLLAILGVPQFPWITDASL